MIFIIDVCEIIFLINAFLSEPITLAISVAVMFLK